MSGIIQLVDGALTNQGAHASVRRTLGVFSSMIRTTYSMLTAMRAVCG